MGWFDLPRVAEPEVMEDSAEVEAYASATAQTYLNRLDDTFVEHAVRLVRGWPGGRALDLGTGPGQIVLKLAARLPGWHFVGIDRSRNMIAQARENLATRSERWSGAAVSNPLCPMASPTELPLPDRVEFSVADGNKLVFPDSSFDLVMSNSVLHHLAKPERVLAEMARVAKPGAAILVRDLRRPSRLAYPLHVRWYGRHYSGLMYRLYSASVRSAYTKRELEDLLCRSPLSAVDANSSGARIFSLGRTHLGIERLIR